MNPGIPRLFSPGLNSRIKALQQGVNQPGPRLSMQQLRAVRNFRWIVADSDLLGGKLAVRGTRFSVSFLLSRSDASF